MKFILNFMSKLGADAAARAIGFLTVPFITRSLGPEGYGEYTYLFVMTSYIGFFIDFGYLNYGTNRIAEDGDAPGTAGKIISLQILSALITYIVFVSAGFLFLSREVFINTALFSLMFIAQIISVRYIYLSAGRLYYNSLSELIGQLVYAALVFTLFSFSPNVRTLILIALIQAFVTGFMLFVPFAGKIRLKISLDPSHCLATLREAYKIGLATKAEAVTATFVTLCTGLFLTQEAVGHYGASNKVYLILLAVIQGLSYAMMPHMLKSAKLGQGTFTSELGAMFYVFLFAGIVCGGAAILFSVPAVKILFGAEFAESAMVLKWFGVTVMIWPVVMFESLILLANNRQGSLLSLSLVSMVSAIAFSFLLISLFGLTGSALVMPAVAVVTAVAGAIMLAGVFPTRYAGIARSLSFSGAAEGFRSLRKHG